MKTLLRALTLFAGILAFVGFGTSAHAQFSASLTGSVLDPTQAAIPNATVTLINNDTHQTQTVKSSAGGTYRFSELPPGNYTVTVKAAGFQQNVLPSVDIAAESPRNVDVTLTTGQESQTVTVNADSVPLLQTGDASIGSTIDSEQIKRLPAFGADPYELIRTAPGITGDAARSGSGGAVFLPNGAGPGGSNSGVYQTENQVQIVAAGQRVSDNNYMIDGVSVNSLTHGGSAVVTPNEEAVGQISVVSTSYDAGDGRNSGAQVKVVTKSGTNQLHGSVFFLYNEPGLNAYNKYGGPALAGSAKVPPVRNQNKQRTWAASLGGPVIKDRLFLFASFQEYKQHQTTYSNTYVETPQFRAAVIANRPGSVTSRILSAPGVQPRIVSNLTNSCAGFGTVGTTCNVVNGGIDVGSLTPGGASQIGSFPTSNLGGGLDGVPDLMNVQLAVPAQSRGNQYNGRIDWQATQKDLIAGSVYFTKLDNLGSSGTAGSRPNADVPFKPLNSAGTLIYIHTFSPAWLNEARANFTRFTDNGLSDAGSTVNYGLPFVNVQGYPFGLQFDPNYSSTTPANFAENTYEVRDTVTHTWGSHTLHAGVELRFEQDNDNLYGEERPLYAMSNLFAFANDAAVYEMVNANPNTGGPGSTQRYFRSQDYAAFVQHDWKVTPTFTLNTGLRWEMFTPLYNKGFDINYPVLGPAGAELSGETLSPRHYLWNFQPNNWGPKVGFAWNPALLNSKFVVRGGYALAYNHLDIALFNNALEDGPGIANFNLCCAGAPTANVPFPASTAGVVYETGSGNSPATFAPNPYLSHGVNAKGFPNSYTFPGTAPGTTITISPNIETYGAAPNLKYPSTDLYSLEIQGQVTPTMTATLGYQGSSGRHYARLVNQNFLYNATNAPAGANYFAQTDSVQNYNALNVQLSRPMRKNIGFSVIYTFSKSLDQVSNGDGANASGNQTNPANNASEYGPSDYDTKHRLVATAVYQTPTVHTGHEALNLVANGWQINGVYTWHTGFPWTPVTGSLNSLPITNGAATINPVRPLAYYGGAGTSCSASAFTTGSNFPNRGGAGGGSNYFNTTLPTGQFYKPGIGRNSFRGPCFQDLDLGVAKEFAHDFGEHHTLLRFQANFYNALNILQLQPLTNGNANGGSNINNQFFGYAQSADEGRVIEFLARILF